MKSATLYLVLLFFGSTTPNSLAQTVTPATPKGFEIRKNGSGTGTGSSIGLVSSTNKQTTQVITYTALSKIREWKNTDGKTMKARLLAFSPPPVKNNAKDKGAQFTVIHDQKVRFLMSPNNKPTIYPLEKLSDFDKEFILKIAKAAAQPANSTPLVQKKPQSQSNSSSKKK